MFETIKRLYEEGKMSDQQLNNAVAKCWITEEQKQEILDSKN